MKKHPLALATVSMSANITTKAIKNLFIKKLKIKM